MSPEGPDEVGIRLDEFSLGAEGVVVIQVVHVLAGHEVVREGGDVGQALNGVEDEEDGATWMAEAMKHVLPRLCSPHVPGVFGIAAVMAYLKSRD